jgi:hypothetical protein
MDLEKMTRARLIPVKGISSEKEAEERATSALLAVLTVVRPLSVELFGPLGASKAAKATVEAYTEVQLPSADGKKTRPDGLIRITYGKATWQALIEVKTGTATLEADQLNAYVQIARANKLDAVVTISNEIAPAPGHHPTADAVPAKNSRVKLHHISWTQLTSTAVRLHEHIGVDDAEQRWLLEELIRYLQHSASGALSFHDMGPAWVAVRDGAKNGTLTRKDPGVVETAQRWDQLIRYTALMMGAQIGLDVTQQLPAAQRREPKFRADLLIASLVDHGTLAATLRIPNTTGDLDITVDLRAQQLCLTTTIKAPEDKGARARAGWIVRQVKDTAPADLTIDARVLHQRAGTGTPVPVAQAIEDPTVLLNDARADPVTFTLTVRYPMGRGRTTKAGKGGSASFIESVEASINAFYDQVLSRLTAWQPKASPRQPVPEPAATQTFEAEGE